MGILKKKQAKYKDSAIKELRSIAENNIKWGKEEIERREDKIINSLHDFFTRHLPQK